MMPLPPLNLNQTAVSGGAPMDAGGFSTGAFTGATGNASATGGMNWMMLAGAALVLFLVMKRSK